VHRLHQVLRTQTLQGTLEICKKNNQQTHYSSRHLRSVPIAEATSQNAISKTVGAILYRVSPT
jgi:hypothetical protein